MMPSNGYEETYTLAEKCAARERVRIHLITLGLKENCGKWAYVFSRKLQQRRFWN